MKVRRPPGPKLLDVAFFAGFLAYAYFGIDSRLIYHWQAPVFYWNTGYLAEFLRYPGGLADYLYSFLAQAYASRLWGAVVLTAQLAAISSLTLICCRARPMLRFVPAVLPVYLLNLYYNRPSLVPLIFGLTAAILFARAKAAPVWLFVALLLPAYYAGGIALVFFALITVGIRIGCRDYVRAAGFVLLAAVLPAAFERSRLVQVPNSARDWFLDPDIRRAAVAWFLYISCITVGFLSQRPRGKVAARRHWMNVLAPAFTLVGLAAICVLSYRTNDRDRRLAAVDYYTTVEDWPEVIAASQYLQSADFNSLTRYEINLALHETNRLGDDMFRFPQSGSTLPPLHTETFVPYMIRITDLFLRLGRINDAEHFGSETMLLGQSDRRVLRLMAEIEMAKGQDEAARKYLAILSDDLGSTRSAQSRDAVVQLSRRRMLIADDAIPVWQNPEKPDADVNRLLRDQLEQDPSNRMAFEFLMGNCLLARDLPAARALMPYIRDMTGPAYITDGVRHTPRIYQEAMAMYADGGGSAVNIEAFEIEPETLSRMAVFKRIISLSSGKDTAMQAAWDRFRDSYFFYFVFGPGDYR